MSCIDLNDSQSRLLAALAAGTKRGDDRDGREIIDELRQWGWVFGNEWVELTGAGHYHAGTAAGGLVGRD